MKKIMKTVVAVAVAALAMVSCEKPVEKAPCKLESFSIGVDSASVYAARLSELAGILEVPVAVAEDTAEVKVEVKFEASANTEVFVDDAPVASGDSIAVLFSSLEQFKVTVKAVDGSVDYFIAVKGGDFKVGLTKAGFFADDNDPAVLAKDAVADVRKSSISVPVVGGGAGKSLVLRLEAGVNDVIYVEEKQVDSLVTVDCSFPINVKVVDEVADKVAVYEIKVANFVVVNWEKIIDYCPAKAEADLQTEVSAIVNPKDGQVYVATAAKLGGSSIKSPVVGKINAAAKSVEIVGTPGMGRTAKNATYLRLANAANGDMFLSYYDATTSGSATMMTKKGEADWAVLGDPAIGAAEVKVTTSFLKACLVDPKSGTPSMLWTSNLSGGQFYRKAVAATYKNDAWAWAGLDGMPNVEGSTGVAYSNSNVLTTADAAYVVISCNQAGYFLVKYDASGYSKVNAEGFLPGHNYSSNIGLVQNSKGAMYMLAADNANTSGYCVNTWALKGNAFEETSFSTIPTELGASTGLTLGAAFDQKDNLYVVYTDPASKKLVAGVVDPDTKDWGGFSELDPDQASSTTYLQVLAAPDGYIYVVYVDRDTTGDKQYRLKAFRGRL